MRSSPIRAARKKRRFWAMPLPGLSMISAASHGRRARPRLPCPLALQLSLATCQWILARGLGLSAPLTLFVLCVPIANVFASLPVTLNGLGVRETAYLMLFGMAGMARADAIALGLLWFAATVLGNLTGVVAFVLTETPPLRATADEPS